MHTLTAQVTSALLQDLGLESLPKEFPDRNSEFPARYLAYNFVRKLEPFSRKTDVPVAVLRNSLATFMEAEYRCRVMNHHGRMYSTLREEDQTYFTEAFRLAKIWINRTMSGYWPRWENARYTGGASRNCSRDRSLPALKWSGYAERSNLSATRPALAVINDYIKPEFSPSDWRERDIDIVDDSRFDFVAKTAKAVRFMAMEPEYNMLAQKCVGDCIRAALHAQGINLDDQRPNQELAYLGSIFRTRATLDQSSASDCISLFLLRLLPERVRDWVLACRTPATSVAGSRLVLEKIATMGNGFIFELQSLIFAAFAHACTQLSGGRECDIAVFGDDIIVSTPVAQPLMDTLEYYGLLPNLEKSYWAEDEPFRESCGKHWFAGRDVTPFYVKEPLGPLRTLFRAYNGLKEWTMRTGIPLNRTLATILAAIPKKDRVIVPPSFSNDCGLHTPVSGCTFPKRTIRHGDIRYSFKCLVDVSEDVTARLDDEVKLRYWLFEPPAELIPRHLYPASRLMGYPREAKRYVRGLGGESRPEVWARREAGPGDAP